jgi:hypothetical protein
LRIAERNGSFWFVDPRWWPLYLEGDQHGPLRPRSGLSDVFDPEFSAHIRASADQCCGHRRNDDQISDELTKTMTKVNAAAERIHTV